MISTNQFKNGTHIEVDGKIFQIIDFQHVKPGKGGAFVRTKLRRIDDGSVIDKTFRAGEKFRPIRTETRKMQYLYDSGDAPGLHGQPELRAARALRRRRRRGDAVGPAQRRGRPALRRREPAGVQVPSAVDLEITQTEPGLKGDTASGGGTKPATLETGVEIQVPLFIEEGEQVRVDTRSGEYVSRA